MQLYILLEHCLCVFMLFVDSFAWLVQVFVEGFTQAGAQIGGVLLLLMVDVGCWMVLFFA